MHCFFSDMPWYAWFICGVYAILWVAFIGILIRMFRKERKSRSTQNDH